MKVLEEVLQIRNADINFALCFWRWFSVKALAQCLTGLACQLHGSLESRRIRTNLKLWCCVGAWSSWRLQKHSIINVSNTYLQPLLPQSLSLLAEYGKCEYSCSEGPEARGMCVCLLLFDMLQTLCLLILLFSLAGVLGQCASLAHLLTYL